MTYGKTCLLFKEKEYEKTTCIHASISSLEVEVCHRCAERRSAHTYVCHRHVRLLLPAHTIVLDMISLHHTEAAVHHRA